MAVASKHGGTLGIAEAIAQEVREAGHSVEVRSTVQVSDLGGVDAVIVGSAIYMGNWLRRPDTSWSSTGEAC